MSDMMKDRVVTGDPVAGAAIAGSQIGVEGVKFATPRLSEVSIRLVDGTEKIVRGVYAPERLFQFADANGICYLENPKGDRLAAVAVSQVAFVSWKPQ